MSSGTVRQSDAKQSSGNKNQGNQGNQVLQDANDVREDFQTLMEDVGTSIHTYCKQRPQMAGLMIFVVGLYVGWKIKPW